jgi:predicted nucleic acid-binding protein
VRVVLDTDVMVAALRSAHGASRRCLLLGLERRITLVVSTPLLLGYEFRTRCADPQGMKPVAT